jgi:hypothetical protein
VWLSIPGLGCSEQKPAEPPSAAETPPAAPATPAPAAPAAPAAEPSAAADAIDPARFCDEFCKDLPAGNLSREECMKQCEEAGEAAPAAP